MESAKVDGAPAEKTPEQIEQEMAHTRDAITHKVAALENQVVGTVQSAADTLTSTVAAVKDIVTGGPSAISDTVKNSLTSVGDVVAEKLDFSKRIRENPWEAIAVAAAAGFVVSLLTGGRRGPAGTAHMTSAAQHFTAPPPSQAPREPGFFDGIFKNIQQEATKLVQDAWDTATKTLKDSLHTEVPKLVKNTVESGTEGVTNRLKSNNLV